jgi:FKBP-type peptidyl-prolyl cis-trans isomerase FklB
MKKITLIAIAAVTLFACGDENGTSSITSIDNNIDSVSYAIGINSAKGLLTNVPEINMEMYLKGFNDQNDSVDLLIATEEVEACLQAFGQKKQMEQMAKQQAEQAQQSSGAKEAGIAFLEANKANPDVKVTASGLQYIVMKEGTGKKPTTASTVTAHYVGMLPDGSVFESSVESGKPIDFPVTGVIAGWTEGLQLMKEGAKYKFFIPEELAYGANPRPGGPIKPFQALVFEVELIKVNN